MSLPPRTPHGVIPSRILGTPRNGWPPQNIFDSNGRVKLVTLFQRMRRNRIVGTEFVAGLKVVPIASLPNSDYETDCLVCRQSYIPEDPAAADNPVQLTCCSRGLHRECIADWVVTNRNNTCLVCRRTLFRTEPTFSAAGLNLATHRPDDDQHLQSLDEHQTPEDEDTEINEYDDDAIMNPNDEWELEYIHFDLEDKRTYEDDDTDEAIIQRFNFPWHVDINNRFDDPPLVPIEQYRELLRSALDLLPISPKQTKLTVQNELSMFRALQRAGAFNLEGMRRMYWWERGWHGCMIFEHLMSKNTKWCVEHGRWMRETEGGKHRHLNFHARSKRRLGESGLD